MPLSMVTVTGGTNGWSNPDGTPGSGQVLFQPVQSATGGGYILAAEQVAVPLAAGNISKQLVNNTQITPLQYLVTEQITGAVNPPPYVVTPTGSTLDLSTAPRGTLGQLTPLYVQVSAIGAANGIVPLDGTSHIPSQYLPSGSGVLSVTALDGTITIGGNAANPTVGVNVIPESKVTGLAADLAALSTAVAAKATRSIVRRAIIANGSDTTLPNTGASWAAVSGFELAIPAAAGDDVELLFNGMRSANTSAFLDVAVIVGTSIVRYGANNTGSPGLEGNPAFYTQTTFIGHGGEFGFTVAPGDLDGGNVRFIVACKSNGTGTLFSSTNYPFRWRALNRGVVG